MSDLSNNLLQQIIANQSDMTRTLGEHSGKIDALRNELVGPSGKNGRIGTLEKDVAEVKTLAIESRGVLRVGAWFIDAAIGFATAFGYHRFIK